MAPNTLYVAVAIANATSALLFILSRRVLGGALTLIFACAFGLMSLAYGAFAYRGIVPDLYVIATGNATAWASLSLVWVGLRRVRGGAAPVWLALMPPALWLGLCIVPAFYNGPAWRVGIGGMIVAILLTGMSTEAFRIHRAENSGSARDLGLILLLAAAAWGTRIIWALTGSMAPSEVAGGWVAIILGIVLPFLIIAVARERVAARHMAREAAAVQAGKAEVERLRRNLPVVVFVRHVTRDGEATPVYCGGDIEAVAGWPPAAVGAYNDPDRLRSTFSAEERQSFLRRCLAGELASMDWQLQQPDGSWRWLNTTGRALEVRPDGTGLVVGYTTNIDVRRTAEAAAAAAGRLASLSEMALGLAHELRQPLGIIAIAAENAVDDLEAGQAAEVRRRLGRIIQQTTRASHVIENLRSFARDTPSSQATGPVVVEDAVTAALETVGSVLQDHAITIRREIESPSPVAVAWPMAVEQVIVNLLLNAKDALEQHGRGQRWVRIAAGADHASRSVTIVVADNGGGLAQAMRERLFQPFATTKGPDRGTGLGLAICHGLVTGMGGRISGHNGPEGAIFTIRLPMAAPPSEGDASAPGSALAGAA